MKRQSDIGKPTDKQSWRIQNAQPGTRIYETLCPDFIPTKTPNRNPVDLPGMILDPETVPLQLLLLRPRATQSTAAYPLI